MSATIAQVSQVLRNGKSVKQSPDAGGLPITRIETIADGTINENKVGYANLTIADADGWILEQGDILISHINSTKHLGKCAIYTGGDKPLVHGMNLLSLRVETSTADCNYIYRVLASPQFRRQLPRITKNSVNQSSFNISNFKKLQLPLPPLAEQKRIAGILDAADALRAKRRSALQELDQLLQSTFLHLFGECERPPISIGKPSFGSSVDFVLISDVANMATGHTPDRKNESYWDGSIPWISLPDIRSLDGTVCMKTSHTVSQAGLDNSSAVLLPKHTVCFSRTASVGYVTIMGAEMATSQDFINWVCTEKIEPVYLMWAFKMSRSYLLSKSAGSTHKTLYHRHAQRFQVYLPPLALQQQFATIVKSIERQKARHRAHLAELDTLFASLQHHAFNGEL